MVDCAKQAAKEVLTESKAKMNNITYKESWSWNMEA